MRCTKRSQQVSREKGVWRSSILCSTRFILRYLQFELFAFDNLEFIIATVQTSEMFLRKSQSEQDSLMANILPKFIHNNLVQEITGRID